jgi:hypothetical protein
MVNAGVAIKGFRDIVTQSTLAVKQFVKSLVDANPAEFLKALISSMKAATTAFAGPLLAMIPNKILSVGNGLIDTLDSLTQKLGKYSPIVAAQQAMLEAQSKILRVHMSRVFEPLMSAWSNVQLKTIAILEAMGPKLQPLINTVSMWVQKIADFLPLITSTIVSGAANVTLALAQFTAGIGGALSAINTLLAGPVLKASAALASAANGLAKLANSAMSAKPTPGTNLWAQTVAGLRMSAAAMPHAPRTWNRQPTEAEQQRMDAAVPPHVAPGQNPESNLSRGVNLGGLRTMPNGARRPEVSLLPGPRTTPPPAAMSTPPSPPPTPPPFQSMKLNFAVTQNIRYELENLADLHASMRDHARRLWDSFEHTVNEAQLALGTGCLTAIYSDNGARI